MEEEIERHRDHLEAMVKERTAELSRQSEVIKIQAQEILEVSTPVLQVWEGIVVATLIGTLDSQRTQRFMERLLEHIVETNSPIALVDITGVPTIDTQTAQHIIDTISAVHLLGAQIVLTGVRPIIAQTLVHLGIDLSGVTTRSSLAAGLIVAMDSLG
jgi:rsbT co-antagonist protein RsbR